MEIYEEKVCQLPKKILTKYKCDICGKFIDSGYIYDISFGHYDWGNDSHESLEYIHACSDECLKHIFNVYMESEFDTKHIRIERMTIRINK